MVLELERPPTAADASRGAPTGAATVAARVTGGGVGGGAPLPPEQHEQRKEEDESDPIVRNLRFISMDEMRQGYNGHLTWAAKLKRIKKFVNRVKVVKMS